MDPKDEIEQILKGKNTDYALSIRVNAFPVTRPSNKNIPEYLNVTFVKWRNGNGLSIVVDGVEFAFPEEKLKQILEFINSK